jgi:hypothetical protein
MEGQLWLVWQASTLRRCSASPLSTGAAYTQGVQVSLRLNIQRSEVRWTWRPCTKSSSTYPSGMKRCQWHSTAEVCRSTIMHFFSCNSQIKCFLTHYWATLFLGGYKYGDMAHQIGGVSDETVKHGYGFYATRTIEWLYSKTADPSSHQRGRPIETRQQLSDKNLWTGCNIWSQVPQWARNQDILRQWQS